MEERKITVVPTSTQKKVVIMSKATTLGELKEDLRKNNVNYNDMTFYEGVSKSELRADDSVLPQNVPFKGTTTNELVFVLTNKNKKIRSGAINSRKDAGKYFKEHPKKAAEFKSLHNGKNWTNCSTHDLLEFINGSGSKVETPKKDKPVQMVSLPKAPIEETKSENLNIEEAFKGLLNILFSNECLNSADVRVIEEILGGTKKVVAEKPEALESSYSDDTLDDMLEAATR